MSIVRTLLIGFLIVLVGALVIVFGQSPKQEALTRCEAIQLQNNAVQRQRKQRCLEAIAAIPETPPSPSPGPSPSPPPTPTPIPPPSGAATYYIAPSGDNAATCAAATNPATPRQTIAGGVACLKAGEVLLLRDGTYPGAVWSIPADVTIAAEHDGHASITGNFSPGDAGFTFQGLVLTGSAQKELGSNNTYRRMSFVGGPSCGNTVNSNAGSATRIESSAFYGRGGRYLFLAYQRKGPIVLQDVLFRPDGGWGASSSCNGYEPHAAYNLYDTEGFTVTRAIVFDAISDASSTSENIGGQNVSTHQTHAQVGTISQSVTTTSGPYGRFTSEGNGSQTLVLSDSVSRGNSYQYGYTRNVNGATTLTRFGTDAQVAWWKGSVTQVSGAPQVTLNGAFLNDQRWRAELCAGVTRGWCGTTQSLGAYLSAKSGVPLSP